VSANTSIELITYHIDIIIVYHVPGIEILPKISPNASPATGYRVRGRGKRARDPLIRTYPPI
jgi:hypothetical protein